MKQKKSPPLFNKIKSDQVDMENGVIKNIVIIEEGVDKYGDNFDTTALKQLTELGNQQGQGLKSRFGHPNMCDSSLGSYLGRYKNFRVDTIPGENRSAVIADLYLCETAKSSPKGDLYSYTLAMAKMNDDMFGNSIVYMPDKAEVKKEKDAEGNEVEVSYERFKSFIASDLVDSPAATTSLFKDSEDLVVKATEFLDENPALFDALAKNPEIVKSFLRKYKNYLEKENGKQI